MNTDLNMAYLGLGGGTLISSSIFVLLIIVLLIVFNPFKDDETDDETDDEINDETNDETNDVVDVDCIGRFTTCDADCKKTYIQSTSKVGNGIPCPYENGSEVACNPGDGDCLLAGTLLSLVNPLQSVDDSTSITTCATHDCHDHANLISATPEGIACAAASCTDAEC